MIHLYLFTSNLGLVNVLFHSNHYFTDSTFTTVFYFFIAPITSISFLIIWTDNIRTSHSQLKSNKTENYHLLRLTYLAQTKNSVYRKHTFTGLFTNFHSFISLTSTASSHLLPPFHLTYFHSFISLTHKLSLVSCLFHRIFNFCSAYENFHTQLEFTSLYPQITCLDCCLLYIAHLLYISNFNKKLRNSYLGKCPLNSYLGKCPLSSNNWI